MNSSGVNKKFKDFVLKYGALYTGFVALVSDVLKPIFEFTFLFMVCSFVLLAMEILVGISSFTRNGKELNNKLKTLTGGYWLTSIFYATLFSSLILSVMFLLSSDKKNGFLSDNSNFVRVIQGDLVDIKNNLVKLVDNSEKQNRKIVEHLDEIHKTLDNSKKEISEDPRKELVNLGIPWTAHSYLQAIRDNDVRILRLFWDGGMNPYYKLDDSDTPAIFHDVQFNKRDWRNIIKVFVDNGKMDLNNDKFMPEKWMFLGIPRVRYSIDSVSLQNHIDREDISAGQAIFCQKLKFTFDDDLRLFNELVKMGSSKKQLMDIVGRVRQGLQKQYGNEFTDYKLRSNPALRKVKGTIEYLGQLENRLGNYVN